MLTVERLRKLGDLGALPLFRFGLGQVGREPAELVVDTRCYQPADLCGAACKAFVPGCVLSCAGRNGALGDAHVL